MNVLIAAATASEIIPLVDHYRQHANKSDVDIVITGIGLTAASFGLLKQVSLKKPDIIIQAGIAGCFDKNISLGTVVMIKTDTIADQMVIENKQLKTMFDLGLIKKDHPPHKDGLLVNPHKNLIRQSRLKAVNAISINQITTDREMIKLYQQKFRPVIESMEGAALHFICLSEKIPFLQIRGISNYIGERDKKKWKIKEAIISLNHEVIRIINDLYNLPAPKESGVLRTGRQVLNFKP